MDIIFRQMQGSHDVWLALLQYLYGKKNGTLMYLATTSSFNPKKIKGVGHGPL